MSNAEMTETQRRAYGVGKDAAKSGADLDLSIDFVVAEGALPDTAEVDRFARMGYAGAS